MKPTWRQRVAGEGLAAQHEEEADRARENRRDAGGGEGGAHEVVFKHARRRARDECAVIVLVPMRVALDVDAARHDEIAVLDAHDLDLEP